MQRAKYISHVIDQDGTRHRMGHRVNTMREAQRAAARRHVGATTIQTRHVDDPMIAMIDRKWAAELGPLWGE